MRSRLLILVLLSTPAIPAAGQQVVGRVIEEGTRRPVAAAFVVVLDSDDRAAAGGLTGKTGGYTLRVPDPGSYRLRIDRIGYRSVLTEPFQLAAGETVVRETEVPPDAVRLGSLEVTGRGRCVLRPEEGERTWSLWSEARKALEVARWTESQRQLRFTVIRFERRLEPEEMVVRSETAELEEIGAGRPFASDDPERLRDLGYVRGDRRERSYFLPDADVLLSDTFLDGHCMRLVDGTGEGRPGMLGLAFEPASPDARSDVAGTLWLDRETNELRTVEVRYVNPGLPGRPDPARYGGWIDFHQLPDGAWIISRWRLRMPLFRVPGLLQRRAPVAYFEEEEAEVLAVADEGGAPVPFRRLGAAISGTVRYPGNGHPLVAAEVELTGTPYHAVTDRDGRFLLEGLPAQRYRLVVRHPALDPAPEPVPVSLLRGDTIHLTLGGEDP